MSETQNVFEPLTPSGVDDKSHSGRTVLIPVIIAGAAAVAGFAIRSFRRKGASTTVLTLAHDESTDSE
jgi:hypothetical protein